MRVMRGRMAAGLLITILTALIPRVTDGAAPRDDFPLLRGPYLGQPPPGAEARLFAPGIVATGMHERDVAMTPDGREIYFGVTVGRIVTILVSRLENGTWTEPAIVPFAADLKYFHFEPCLSADGKRMLFLTNRPPQGEKPAPGWTHQNIWAVDRGKDGRWSAPHDLGAPINTQDAEFFPSLARDGTLYFTRSDPKTERTAILRSRLVDGRYQEPEALPAAVNGRGHAYNAFVARDESYLIASVDGRDDSRTPGLPNYYIFFRDGEGTWSDGVNLGERANFSGAESSSSYVSPDGRYLFFSSTKAREIPSSAEKPATSRTLREYFAAPQNGNADIYWIDASFLETLRPPRRE
jgi:hypothetical protein